MILSNKIYEVYWLHLKEHDDIKTQGYVGITSKTAESRFINHCKSAEKFDKFTIHKAIRKHGAENIVVDLICITDDEHARWIERNLRPEPFIGWNMQRGGIGNPYLTPEVRQAATAKGRQTIEERGGLPCGEDHHNWKGGVSEGYKRRNGIFVKKSKDVISDNAKKRSKAFMDAGGVWPSSRPEVRETFSKVHKKRFEDNGWWVNSQANKTLWLSAAKVMLFRKITALPKNLIAEMIGVPQTAIPRLTDKLFSGWNPLEDERWVKWYEQNKTEGDPTIEELTVHFRESQCLPCWP